MRKFVDIQNCKAYATGLDSEALHDDSQSRISLLLNMHWPILRNNGGTAKIVSKRLI